MKRLRKRVVPRVESLESLTLLSVVSGVPTTGTNTGVGSVGSATVADAQGLQQDSSGGFLEQYISQLEVVDGRLANVRQYAQSVLSDHQLTNFDLQNAAATLGLTLPTGIALPTDVHDAETVLAATRGKNLDKTYLKIMRQINAQDVANDQYSIGSTSNATVNAYVTETLAYDQNHLQGAKQLTDQPKSTYSPTIATPSLIATPPFPSTSKPALSFEAQALIQDASGGYLEQIISEIEVQYGTRSDVRQFAQTVVGDHQVTNYGLIDTALASSVSFAAGVQQQADVQALRQVLNAVRRGNLDKTYLQVMVAINALDVDYDLELFVSTTSTNAGIHAYAQDTVTYDRLHLQAAETLQVRQTDTYTPGSF